MPHAEHGSSISGFPRTRSKTCRGGPNKSCACISRPIRFRAVAASASRERRESRNTRPHANSSTATYHLDSPATLARHRKHLYPRKSMLDPASRLEHYIYSSFRRPSSVCVISSCQERRAFLNLSLWSLMALEVMCGYRASGDDRRNADQLCLPGGWILRLKIRSRPRDVP